MKALTESQKQKLDALCPANGVILAVLYGSQVEGRARKESDTDIALLVHGKPDHALFVSLYQGLSDIFSGSTIDVRFLNGADPLFGLQVVKNGVLIYGNGNDFNTLKTFVNRRYIDDGRKYFPFRDELLREQQKQFRRQL